MRMSSLGRQAGLSIYQLMIVLVVIGFFGVLAFTLGPLYLRNVTVQSTVQDLKSDQELAGKSVTDIRNAIERRFDVNRIQDIQAVCRKKDVPCMKIEKSSDMLTINANYESRVHVMFNVDAVVVFSENVVEIPIRGG